jgi:BolA protein
MTVTDDLRSRLQAAFAPDMLSIENQSHLHAGHAGDDGSGESHFRVAIRSAALAGLSRVDRHRAVHQAIGEDLLRRIHALALDLG